VLKRTVALLAVLLLAGCTGTSQQRAEVATVDRQQEQYSKAQPTPFFDWSQDRDTLIQIYKLKNEARQTWTVITGWDGRAVWSCPSRGYPLPADAQLTNPLQRVIGGEGAVIEQAEPNGLFSSKSTDATYVLCVRSNGEVVPVYTELKATAFPFAVRVENGQIVDDGQPATASVKVGRP